jgi:hypothetical protein
VTAPDEERKRCAKSTARPQRHELQERVASRPNNPLRATSSTRTSLWFDGGSAGSSCSLSKHAMCEIYKTGVTHKPSFVNAIFEEAYAMAQMSEADG